MSRLERHHERGASTVELAVLTPVFMMTVLLAVQFTFYYHGRQVALAASQAGAREARTLAGQRPAAWQTPATAKAHSYLDMLGPDFLADPSITPIARQDDQVGIEVRGYAVTVIPSFQLAIRTRSVGPIERFIPDAPGR